MATTLTGYGGVGEIGGNAFLLESSVGPSGGSGTGRTSRLLLDFGKRFGTDQRVETHGTQPGWNDYFDDYLKPRGFRYVSDLVDVGILPARPEWYRQDLGGSAIAHGLDGVIVSHAHMDHAGMIGLLKPDIPIMSSSASRAVLASIQVTGQGPPEADFIETKAKGRVGRDKDGALTVRPKMADGPMRAWETEARLEAGGWTVTQLGVDHSIPGAQATIVEGPDGTLCYTGDFRLHGRGKHLSEKLVERAGGVNILVAEGTNVHRGHRDHAKQTDMEITVEATIEQLVQREMGKVGQRSGFIGISYPPRDLDRFQSIHAVAKRIGRRFAISVKQAHLIDSLRRDGGRDDLPDPRTDMSLAVYFEAANKGLLLESPDAVPVAESDLSVRPVDARGGDVFAKLIESEYPVWMRPYLSCPTFVGPLDVRREPQAFLLSISFWSITELFDIFPDRAKANGLYIHSQTQPFNDDMLQDRRKLMRWLTAYNLEFAQTHVSGHLDQKGLEWVLDAIRPRTLVPVHTEGAQVTADRYQARTGMKAAIPAYGLALQLG